MAVVVFALVAAAGYAGLDQLSRAASAQREAAEDLERWQMLVSLLEQDISQSTRRPVRDNNGQRESAVLGDNSALFLTRGGWANPLELPRSNLKRIEWRFNGQTLQRWLWPVLDRTASSSPGIDAELTDLQRARFRYRDSQGQWLDQWPPRGQEGLLPRAVEVNLERDTHFTVRRLIEVIAE